MSYNGWENYETWNVALWLGNNEGSDSYWNERAEEAKKEAKAIQALEDRHYLTIEERAVRLLSEQIEAEVQDANPLCGEPSMYSDILSANLGEVNWNDIARGYLED